MIENAQRRPEDWKASRRKGVVAIALSRVLTTVLWLVIARLAPPLSGMETLEDRMLFALKCSCVAALFCLVTGVQAVAHERLQSPAFDPLAGHETRRLRVNLRYLQNTLEQFPIFALGLFGLAAYGRDGGDMRAVLATTVLWILARGLFWIGYHWSAALRGLGAPGMMIGLLVLIYVVARIGFDVAGWPGAAAVVGAFLLIEAVLFRTTRSSA